MEEVPSSTLNSPQPRTFLHKTTRAFTTIPLPARLSLLLLVAVVLLFAPAVNFEFLNYDDDMHVYANHKVTKFTAAKLPRIWRAPIQGLYIPLTYTTWGMLGRLSAWLHPATDPTILDPAVFHTANIILHTGTVLVVFAILRLLLQRDWPAAFGALLFGLHPVQVSPVAWVSEMKGLLAGFLGLLAILQYLRYASTDPTPTFRSRRYLTASCLFCAALLAKPNVTSVPLMAAVLAVLLQKRDWRRVALELSPWLLLTIPLALITKGIQPSSGLEFVPNLWQRFLVAGDAVTFYHTKLLWPFGLAPDYGRDPQEVLSSGWIYLTGLMPFVVAALLIWQVRRTWLVAGALVFVAALLPVLGFIPFGFQDVSTVANRYLYSAMLAPALIFGRLLYLYPGRRTSAIAAIILLLLAMRSADRLSYWHDSLTFNLRAVEINPNSSLAHNNLGIAYIDRGQINEALAAFEQAVLSASSITPAQGNFARAYLRLGMTAAQNNDIRGAMDYYTKALEIDPNIAETHGSLGIIYTRLNQYDEAIAHYRRAIELDPDLEEALINLGQVYELAGRREEAVTAYRQAIWLHPERPEAFNNLGKLRLDDNELEEALNLLRQATDRSPNHPTSANNLAQVYLKLGRAREAAEWFRVALNIAPDFAEARNGLASAEALEKSPLAGNTESASEELHGP